MSKKDKNKPGKPTKESKEFLEKWKDPEQNKMGNDISSEIKIANSGGSMEGGSDKRWHMEDSDEKKQ